MTVHTEYDAPAVWLPRVILLLDAEVERCLKAAHTQHHHGLIPMAEAYATRARVFNEFASCARRKLAELAPKEAPHVHTERCLTLNCGGYLSQEPPSTLVEMVDWLRAQMGPRLPWVPVEIWQKVACLILLVRTVRP